MKRTINNKNGFTLIEILLITGIIAIATLGVYTAYTKADIYMKVLEETKNLDILREGAFTLSENQSSFINLNNTTINNSNITPSQMRDGTANGITSSIANTVTVSPATIGTVAANNGFIIEYQGVPINYCAKLIGQAGNKFEELRVNGTVVKEVAVGQIDIDSSATASACDDNAAGATIQFVSVSPLMNSLVAAAGAVVPVINSVRPVYTTPLPTENILVGTINPTVAEASKARYWGNPTSTTVPNPTVTVQSNARTLGYNYNGTISFNASQKNIDMINAALDGWYKAQLAANGGNIPASFTDPMFKNDSRAALQVVAMHTLAEISGQARGGYLPATYPGLIANFKTYIGQPHF